MKGKERKRPGALAALSLRLGAAVLALWLVCMAALTALAAEYAAQHAIALHRDRAEQLAQEQLLNLSLYDGEDRDYELWQMAGTVAAMSAGMFPENSWPVDFFPETGQADYHWADGFYTPPGDPILGSWQDFLVARTFTPEEWEGDAGVPSGQAIVYLDREKLTDTGRQYIGESALLQLRFDLRITGVLDGIELTPTRIDGIPWDWEEGDVFQEVTLYEDTEAAPAGGETVTLYASTFSLCCPQTGPDFAYQDQRYAGVQELLREQGPFSAAGSMTGVCYEGGTLLLLSMAPVREVGENGLAGDVICYVASAVQTAPWRTAIGGLWPTYLRTFLLALVCFLLLRRTLRRKLLDPVRRVSASLNQGWSDLFGLDQGQLAWRESHELVEGYQRAQGELQRRKDETARLTAALDYAKRAEDNRRQMTSHIAHELKTPLAVIHSYAEGLRERIAEGKREQYLDTILSETERMDAMVLEMLDLSRLEAGRVKLTRSQFSLAQLTRDTFQRLQRAVEAKELHVSYIFSDEGLVTADEGRIAQVVENFATNAVKYTPPGGHILVRIQRQPGQVQFRMENESPPLSQEALDKVWDTFYRADEARAGGGTGLGLAIARSIVQLHGGKCSARNTRTGVEFGFTL